MKFIAGCDRFEGYNKRKISLFCSDQESVVQDPIYVNDNVTES